MSDADTGQNGDERQPDDGLLKRHPRLGIIIVAAIFYLILCAMLLVVLVLIIRG